MGSQFEFGRFTRIIPRLEASFDPQVHFNERKENRAFFFSIILDQRLSSLRNLCTPFVKKPTRAQEP